jgi:peptide/nickel transport system permease protein
MENDIKRRSQFTEVWSRLRVRPTSMISLAGIIILILIAIFANLIADYDSVVIAHNIPDRLQPPSMQYWFGTDMFGRDIFARIIHGVRTAMLMGFVTTLVSISISTVLACWCAYFGGIADNIIMRIVDVLTSIPSLLIAITIVASLGNGMWQLVVALSIGSIPMLTRMIRSSAISIVNMEYIESAKAIGAKTGRIISKHLFPNIISMVIVQGTAGVARTILIGAMLSFVGLGVRSPMPEWGLMLNEGMALMRTHSYMVMFPGIAIILTSLCIMTFGDDLRDAFDPQLKGRA